MVHVRVREVGYEEKVLRWVAGAVVWWCGSMAQHASKQVLWCEVVA